MPNFRERIEGDDLFFDSGIVSHGYAPHLRDYDIVIDVPAALPPGVPIGDTTGSYITGRYRYRFTHCPESHITSCVGDDSWRLSWDDVFIDYESWEFAGNPEGFVWGVSWADDYPGLSYVTNSPLAASWTERLGHEMHEVTVETNTFVLRSSATIFGFSSSQSVTRSRKHSRRSTASSPSRGEPTLTCASLRVPRPGCTASAERSRP